MFKLQKIGMMDRIIHALLGLVCLAIYFYLTSLSHVIAIIVAVIGILLLGSFMLGYSITTLINSDAVFVGKAVSGFVKGKKNAKSKAKRAKKRSKKK